MWIYFLIGLSATIILLNRPRLHLQNGKVSLEGRPLKFVVRGLFAIGVSMFLGMIGVYLVFGV